MNSLLYKLCTLYICMILHTYLSGAPGHNRLGHCQFGFSIALTDVSNFIKLIHKVINDIWYSNFA